MKFCSIFTYKKICNERKCRFLNVSSVYYCQILLTLKKIFVYSRWSSKTLKKLLIWDGRQPTESLGTVIKALSLQCLCVFSEVLFKSRHIPFVGIFRLNFLLNVYNFLYLYFYCKLNTANKIDFFIQILLRDILDAIPTWRINLFSNIKIRYSDSISKNMIKNTMGHFIYDIIDKTNYNVNLLN